MDKNLFSFEGKLCCLFDYTNAEIAYKNMDFRTIKEYGDCVKNPDGSIKHWNFAWDDGHRSLFQCKRCGAYFIYQSSEYHASEDSYYSDWYQVEDEHKASIINDVLDGDQLDKEYKAPRIIKTNGKLSWNKDDF